MGGLGVKHVGAFNFALLSKWLWRTLSEPKTMWMDLLTFMYGGEDP